MDFLMVKKQACIYNRHFSPAHFMVSYFENKHSLLLAISKIVLYLLTAIHQNELLQPSAVWQIAAPLENIQHCHLFIN